MSEIWKSARYYDIEDSIKVKLGVLLSDPPPRDTNVYILLPILIGCETKEHADGWIRCFGRWAIQEGLSDDLALLFALEYMKCTSHAWAGQFYDGHTWEDFVRRYFQRVSTCDLNVAQEVERYMKWYRREYEKTPRSLDAVRFSCRELAKATFSYCENNILGGGLGTVYRGSLSAFGVVAIKKLRELSWEALARLKADVDIISQCKHPNLVKLIGCSLVLKEPVLVYEYVPNGNLREHLNGFRGSKLDWATRLRIATETAQALTHLHLFSSTPIQHWDVKSRNILLDESFSAKVADFGISKTLLTDDCNLPTLPRGTTGYIDPHYLQTFQLSAKSDVYSFGVVLLEIVSGMQVVEISRQRNKITLAALAISRLKSGRFCELVDSHLVQTASAQDLKQCKKVSRVALNCVSMDPAARPSMKEVLVALKEIKAKHAHK